MGQGKILGPAVELSTRPDVLQFDLPSIFVKFIFHKEFCIYVRIFYLQEIPA